jgi:hypothetical protein
VAGNIAMFGVEELQYLAHIMDESYMANAVPLTFKRINEESRQEVDDLFDEVLPEKKKWTKKVINGVAVNHVDQETQDRFGFERPVDLIVSISYLELKRQGWELKTQDFLEYRNQDGEMVDYSIEKLMHDGMYRDIEGNEYPLSYTVALTDAKGNTF